MKLLLFDIDGTLMLSGGAGRRAIDRTFFEAYGIDNAFGDVVPDGNTDPMIFREIIRNHDVTLRDGSAELAGLIRRYTDHMADEMGSSEGARLMPGVIPLLEHLDGIDELALGLLTGNFETTARIKLGRFELNRFFGFGAFSSDDPVRNRLVPVAVDRAEVHLGRPIGIGRHVFVIGDTPRDVECALANGATAIGVAASNYTVGDLERAGAHVALPTLEDITAFLAAIDTCTPSAPTPTGTRSEVD